MILKTLGMNSKGQRFLRDGAEMRGALQLENLQTMRQKGRTQVWPGILLELKKQSSGCGGPRWNLQDSVPERRDLHNDSGHSRDPQTIPLEYSGEC